jgi:hypothetical protein
VQSLNQLAAEQDEIATADRIPCTEEPDHMAQMTAVIQQLKKERERAARQVAQLDAALAALSGAAGKRRETRTLSAAARSA